MNGIHEEGPQKAQRQPPYVLAAWIQGQLGELRETQVRTLAELRAQLQNTAFEWDATALAQAVSNLRSAGRELRFDNLRAGWLARRMGKHKPVYARFGAAHERIVVAAQKMGAELDRLGATIKAHTSASKRLLVELDMESRALQAEIDRGVTWLQDLCAQINEARQRGSRDPDLATFAEAAQAFTQEFKRLQTVTAIARDVGVRMQGLIDRRGALVELVRASAQRFNRDWMPNVGELAAAVQQERTVLPGLGEAFAAHDDLLVPLETVTEACTALQHEEHLMAQHLDVLRRELEPQRQDT